MKASWNGITIAESDETIIVEGNHYFPPNSIRKEFFRSNNNHTSCHWKGSASYYDVVINGDVNSNAAWYYADPKSAANNIKDYIAFWNGVQVTN